MTIDHKLSGTSMSKLEYYRNGVGEPLEMRGSGSSFMGPDSTDNVVRYGYDPAGRLSEEVWGVYDPDWSPDGSYEYSWSYDWAGNRDPLSNTYNQVDEMSGYQYDMLGNVEYDPDSSSSPRTRYYYNSDNLLSQVDCVNGGTTTTTTMTWDADQQRLKLASGLDTWEMLYDRVAGIPAVLLAKSYVSSTTSLEYYVRAPGGELLASFIDGETPTRRYCHFDQLGNMVLQTNGSGGQSISRTFSAWGTDLSGGGYTSLPYQYVGELGYYSHIGDQGTSLQNLFQLGVRFYDPEIGRFTQRDPIPPRYSAYEYAAGWPTVAVDPSGLVTIVGVGDSQITLCQNRGGHAWTRAWHRTEIHHSKAAFIACMSREYKASAIVRGICVALCAVLGSESLELTFVPCFVGCLTVGVGDEEDIARIPEVTRKCWSESAYRKRATKTVTYCEYGCDRIQTGLKPTAAIAGFDASAKVAPALRGR